MWQWGFWCCFFPASGYLGTPKHCKTRENTKWQIDPALPPPHSGCLAPGPSDKRSSWGGIGKGIFLDPLFCGIGRLILIHLQCWEMLPFLTIQRQRCIKFRVLREEDFYTPLALNYQKGQHLRDRLLSSAGTGKNCTLSIRFPDPSPVLDKNRAPMGPEILSSTGAGVCRKAPKAFPDSSSVLDKFRSASTSQHWRCIKISLPGMLSVVKVVCVPEDASDT